jgi:predicted peroxiredoxin
VKSTIAWLGIVAIATGIAAGAATGVAAATGADASTGADAAVPRDGVFIHISHGADDPHRVLMALSMANIMALDHDVLVYFDISGVEVVLEDAADLTYAHFSPSNQQIANLLEKDVTIMACPGCLKAAGKSPADLGPGIEVADKQRFFSFTQGRILSLDY